jgi:hypothetical protein
MVTEETINDVFSDILNHNTKTSRLAVTSMVFGLLAPVCFVAVGIVSLLLSYLSSHDLFIVCRHVMIAFSYSVAWILGLVLGLKSLEKIRNNEQHLVGKAYAFVGISISAVWMVWLIARFLLPALFYVNS